MGRKLIVVVLVALAMLISSAGFALAGDDDLAGLLGKLSGWISAIGAGLAAVSTALIAAWRRVSKMSSRMKAAEEAIAFYDSMNRGVVLYVTYNTEAKSAVPMLEAAGWTVCRYEVLPEEGDLPQGGNFMQDLGAADVVVLHGQDADGNARLAQNRRFQEGLAHGATVLGMVPNFKTRYNQGLWGTNFQGVTNPITCRTAVMNGVHNRRLMQRLLGVPAGGLAAARAKLVGSSKS